MPFMEALRFFSLTYFLFAVLFLSFADCLEHWRWVVYCTKYMLLEKWTHFCHGYYTRSRDDDARVNAKYKQYARQVDWMAVVWSDSQTKCHHVFSIHTISNAYGGVREKGDLIFDTRTKTQKRNTYVARFDRNTHDKKKMKGNADVDVCLVLAPYPFNFQRAR